MWMSPPMCAAPLHSSKPSTARRPAPPTRRSPPKRQNRISVPSIHFREVVCMLGIFGLFLQAAAGHILYLVLHLESGSFPRPLPPDRERAAFADLQKGGAAAAQARDTLIRHNLRLVAHICKKYYAGNSAQDDMISIGTIGLIKAVDTFDPAKGKRFASYATTQKPSPKGEAFFTGPAYPAPPFPRSGRPARSGYGPCCRAGSI